MSENGRLPDADLASIPGGRLRKDAAGAWLALRGKVGKERGVWICPTSTRTAYRPFADQEHFWNLFQQGRGALAARPGTSNHGWGIAVDLPAPAMQAALREHGHAFGWGIRGGQLNSDAPSESWHCSFHPGVYDGPVAEHRHPYHVLNDREQAARDVLVKARRIARRKGGWAQVDGIHLERASKAKATLKDCCVDLQSAAKKSGWEKADRKTRHDYLKNLIGA